MAVPRAHRAPHPQHQSLICPPASHPFLLHFPKCDPFLILPSVMRKCKRPKGWTREGGGNGYGEGGAGAAGATQPGMVTAGGAEGVVLSRVGFHPWCLSASECLRQVGGKYYVFIYIYVYTLVFTLCFFFSKMFQKSI